MGFFCSYLEKVWVWVDERFFVGMGVWVGFVGWVVFFVWGVGGVEGGGGWCVVGVGCCVGGDFWEDDGVYGGMGVEEEWKEEMEKRRCDG